METLPIPRTTIVQLVATYRKAELTILESLKKLRDTEQELQAAFGDQHGRMDLGSLYLHGKHYNLDDTGEILGVLLRQAWGVLFERMELRRILSTERINQMDEQLRTGKDLLPITENNVLGLLEGTMMQMKTFHQEAVKEVYDWLIPRHERFKTNSIYEVRERVVIPYAVRVSYQGRFEPGVLCSHYNREAQLRNLDNVFHTLDGQGTVKTYGGPLCDAIKKCTTTDNRGETDYFEFRCFRNGNLHLRFKRLDLLAQFNAIAGGNTLKPNNTTSTKTETQNELTLQPI